MYCIRSDYKSPPTHEQIRALGEALKTNNIVEEVSLSHSGVSTKDALVLADALKVNKSVARLDLSHNSIGAEAILAIAEALQTNSTLKELRIGNQSHKTGDTAEAALGKLFDTNTTLCTLELVVENQAARLLITKGEVRNREIAKRMARGEDWTELDPSRRNQVMELKRKQRQEEQQKKAEETAEITEKVPSTGGPYTMRQLCCKKQFQPDDVDQLKREMYLSDADFQQVFAMDKMAFEKLPTWKKAKLKKDKNLF
jgi:hypothetical protein